MVQESYEPMGFGAMKRTFQQLSCANCGEPLQLTEKDAVLTCELCGQGHKSLPPPPIDTGGRFQLGDGVAVLWGERWWSAHVTEVLGGGRWRVHYEGWAPSFDEIVDISRIRALDYVPGSSIVPPVFETKLKVKRANIFSAVAIVMVIIAGFAFLAVWALGDQVFNIQSKRSAEFEAANFGAIIGRTPGTALREDHAIQSGQKVYVKWRSGWYPGTALEVIAPGRILVHYDGWSDAQNEVVSRDRLRALP
jgi:hypothetical protein